MHTFSFLLKKHTPNYHQATQNKRKEKKFIIQTHASYLGRKRGRKTKKNGKEMMGLTEINARKSQS
jgi:hypothetical protein